MGQPRGRRTWTILVTDLREHPGSDGTNVDDAAHYGPYSDRQTDALLAIGSNFPPGTVAVVAVQPGERPRFGALARELRDKAAEELKEYEVENRPLLKACGDLK